MHVALFTESRQDLDLNTLARLAENQVQTHKLVNNTDRET